MAELEQSLNESSSDVFSFDGNSSPLSRLSMSPSPPPNFKRSSGILSPPSSQSSSQCSTPTPDGMAGIDGPPSAKRRRISKERSTEHLDLSAGSVLEGQQPQLERIIRALHKRRKIVVVAGAGISVSAGIPDFRSSTGLFSSLKTEHKLRGSGKDLFDASVYRDQATTESFHDMVRDMSRLTKDAKPTAFHQMIASLAQENRLLRLYSQNVDGIDTGLQPLKTTVPLCKNEDGKWPKTVQLHGGLEKMVCLKCHTMSDLDATLFEGPLAPPCAICVERDGVRLTVGKRSHGIGRLRPRMVLYSEPNPDEDAIGAVAREDLRRRPDAVIVVGTTLKIPGVRRIVREMCGVARDHRDGLTIWISNDPPPTGPQFEDCFDVVVNGPADTIAACADLPHWDATPGDTLAAAAALTSKTKTLPAHLVPELTPSGRYNNSFKAPQSDNKLASPAESRPSPEFSPMVSRFVNSIEKYSDHDSISSSQRSNGLPTPTESARGNSPLAKVRQLNLTLLRQPTDKKIKNKTTKPTAKRAKATKQSKQAPHAQAPLALKIGKSFNSVTSVKEKQVQPTSYDSIHSTPRKLQTIPNAQAAHTAIAKNKTPTKVAKFPNLRGENLIPKLL